MHMVMTGHFGSFLLMLIVTLPLFEPLQSQNISSISHNCETKQITSWWEREEISLFYFFSYISFSVGEFIVSRCVAFSENVLTESSINALKS